MKRLGLLSFLASVLLLLPLLHAGCDPCEPAPGASLDVPLRGQETNVWCWAASGEMCMDYLETDVSQCDEANKRFGRTDCCDSPRPRACVQTGWPEFEKYGFSYERTSDTALTWDQLKSQISCKRKPFAFSWHWAGGGGHMMVVYGYTESGSNHWVYYENPLPVGAGSYEFKSYDMWVADPGSYTHWDDFYDITKE